jgi:DDE superfamily endonuclease
MPYNSFLELVELANQDAIFRRWREGNVDAMSREATPISLLILCVLRYLGRGWTMDDLSENTGISREVIRCFLHKFLDFGSTVLFTKYVVAPTTAEGVEHHTREYAKAGLPGCVGSMDATHIPLEKVEFRLRQNHLGFKMPHTTRTYNITVNHRRRILASTSGHPGRWNDKTLVLFDHFAVSLNEGRTLQDCTFELYERNSVGEVVRAKYRGAWLIVDNGYLNWSTTIPPIKRTCNRAEIRFSAWLESIRKDVECTFGILKSRFRILKTGIRLHRQEAADKIFLTCCALHNWLLDVDGLDPDWREGAPSEWETALGNHSLQDVQTNLPPAVVRLLSPAEMRGYDASHTQMEHDEDDPGEEEFEESVLPQGEVDARQERNAGHVRVVKDLSLSYFRAKLVQHFDIAFHKNEIVWPGKRNRINFPPPI